MSTDKWMYRVRNAPSEVVLDGTFYSELAVESISSDETLLCVGLHFDESREPHGAPLDRDGLLSALSRPFQHHWELITEAVHVETHRAFMKGLGYRNNQLVFRHALPKDTAEITRQ